MTERYLTITLQPDWKSALRAAGQVAKADTYQGEVLKFETPAQFFGPITDNRKTLGHRACSAGQGQVNSPRAGTGSKP